MKGESLYLRRHRTCMQAAPHFAAIGGSCSRTQAASIVTKIVFKGWAEETQTDLLLMLATAPQSNSLTGHHIHPKQDTVQRSITRQLWNSGKQSNCFP